jgi:DNA-directed RNA polymerase beta' subunit
VAQVTNTYDTYASKRGRETLADTIDRLTPEETPLLSNIGRQTLEGTHPEWNIEALATPNSANKRVQGDIYSFSAITPTSRIGNYTQISMKEFIVSETEEAVSKAGPKSDYNRTMVIKGLELKIDQEVTLLGNQASLAGNSTTPPQTATLRSWIATNDFMGATGTSGGFNTGTGVVDVAVNGTQRAFTKALLDTAISRRLCVGWLA